MTQTQQAPSADTGYADGLQQIVDGLSARLGRSVAVDDARGRLVAASRHYGDEDDLRVYAVLQRVSDPRVLAHFRAHDIYSWTVPGRIPADPEMRFSRRVCCPARVHGILFGHLFLIDDGVTDREVELAAEAAAEIGRLMHRRLVLHEQVQGHHEQLARDLISDSDSTRSRARATVVEEFGLQASTPARAIVLEAPGPGPRTDDADTVLRAALERTRRDRTTGRSLLAVHGRRGLLLLFGDAAEPAAARSVGAALTSELATGIGCRVVAGLGPRCAGADAEARSHRTAMSAAHAAALLPGLGDVVDDEDLGPYATLLALPRESLHESLYPEGLRTLIAHDSGDVLLGTLETYLDCCGDTTRAAARLTVHRSTLYYRLGRIEAVTGTSLADGHRRLALHLGVKMHRLAQAYAAHPELDRTAV